MEYGLKGCYDLHVHTGPDIMMRKMTDLQLAQRAQEVGMKGFAIKNHIFPTGARALLLRQLYPQMDIVGGIALNQEVGGINAAAVAAAAKMGAKMLWFPTVDSKAYRKENKKANWKEGLSAVDTDGRVTQETLTVLETAKKYDMVVGTGHLGRRESIAVIKAACEKGVSRLCLTHVTLPICQMSLMELKQCAACGAMLEYSYCHVLSGKCTIDYIVSQILEIGSEHVILTSDLGQTNNPDPVNGLHEFCLLLKKNGIHDQDLDQMLKNNPQKLLYGTSTHKTEEPKI